MDDHPIEVYSKVAEDFNQASNKLRVVADLCSDLGRHLQVRPYEGMINNVTLSLPSEIATSQKCLFVNRDDWLDIEELAQMIDDFHRTSKIESEVWGELALEHRRLVTRVETRRPEWL